MASKSPDSPSPWVPGVGVVVGEGNNDNGSSMHPAICELASPILTAIAIPATNSERQNNDELELLSKSLTYWNLVQ